MITITINKEHITTNITNKISKRLGPVATVPPEPPHLQQAELGG